MDEDSVDISGVASKLNQEYGINIAEEKLAGILSSHWILAGPWHHQYKSNPNPEDNAVAGCLLLLHKNSTLISGITDDVAASNVPPTEDYPMIGIEAEELPPPIEEMVEELHSTIGVVDGDFLPPIGVVAGNLLSPIEVVNAKVPCKGVFLEQVATTNLSNTTTTMQNTDQMVERCNPDHV